MKMTRLNYKFDNEGVSVVEVGFEDWAPGDVQYNITVKLHADDADLTSSTPAQLAEAAKAKVAALVISE